MRRFQVVEVLLMIYLEFSDWFPLFARLGRNDVTEALEINLFPILNKNIKMKMRRLTVMSDGILSLQCSYYTKSDLQEF